MRPDRAVTKVETKSMLSTEGDKKFHPLSREAAKQL